MFDKAKHLKRLTFSNPDSFQPINMFDKPSVTYTWTRRPNLLKQYTQIINNSFDAELNLRSAYKQINDKDLKSHFGIAMENDRVIAGMRLTVNDMLSEYSLPTERPDFSFKKLFPELDLEHSRYAEISRFTIVKEYRNNNQHYVMAFSEVKQLCRKLGVRYLFICASSARLKLYNRMAKEHFDLIGIKNFDVTNWEDYSDLEFMVAAYELI